MLMVVLIQKNKRWKLLNIREDALGFNETIGDQYVTIKFNFHKIYLCQREGATGTSSVQL